MKPSQPLNQVWRLRKVYGQTQNPSLLTYTKQSLNKGVESVAGLIYQKTIGKVPPSMIRTMEEAQDDLQKRLQLVKATAAGTINTVLPPITEAAAAAKRSAGNAYDQALYLKQTGIRGLVLNGYELAKKKADDSVKRTREKIDEMVRQMQQRALEQARGVQTAAKTEINRRFDMARDRAQKSVEHVKCEFTNVVNSAKKRSEKAIADAKKAVGKTFSQVKDNN